MSTTPYFLRNPAYDDQAQQPMTMAPAVEPQGMAAPVIQHPMHAMVAPIVGAPKLAAMADPADAGPAPASMSPSDAAMMAPAPSSDLPATKQPTIRTMSPIERREDVLQQGMAKKPEGFWGKLGHGLGMAGRIAGDIIAPAETELVVQGLGKEGIGPRANEFRNKEMLELEAEKSKEGLEGAQASKAQADVPFEESETAKNEAGLPYVGPLAKSELAKNKAEVFGLENPWAKSPDNQPLTDVASINKGMEDRYQVLHPGQAMPAEYQLSPNATKGDFDKRDKLMTAAENALGTQQQREAAEQMRQAMLKIAQQRISISLNNEGTKGATATRAASYKAYQPALDSAERFDVMAQNYEDAIKNHDQQAMLSLLYNHMGMTMGLQKGARMTQALIQEAQQSQPWLRNLKAHYDKDGYLSGVVLSQPQMLEMVHNAQGRYQGDVKKSRSEAQYMGATDDGPKRDPNEATQRYYLSQTGGDANKARALMRNDGWTF